MAAKEKQRDRESERRGSDHWGHCKDFKCLRICTPTRKIAIILSRILQSISKGS